jgi:hypothetical protein
MDTPEPAGADGQHNTPSLRWEIGQCSPVPTVDAGGYGPTARASGGDVEGARINQHFGRLGFDAFDGEPARSKRDLAIRDGDFLSIRRSRLGQIASGLSQSPF